MTRKINTIHRTATLAWCPSQDPLLATGTMTGAISEDFSSASELEIFPLNSNETSYKVSTTSKFNTLAWGQGIIAGGMETNELELWNFDSIVNHKSTSSVQKTSIHTGKLAALDFNFFQTNLLASAGSHSEVYIWDMNQPDTPFTPGTKSLKMDEISSVAWNCQVQHILSTASTNGYTVVWDLRNKKEVMSLPGRTSLSSIAWNPDVATQIVTASDDDQNPVISLWDLRHAHSPEKVMSGHTKGVLDISWCRKDSDLLVSCGKDSKTLCWNPNKGDLIGQISSNHAKWTYCVDWCPRNPDLLASSSFDGSINVFSIQSLDKQHSDSFTLSHPPKWLRRPIGASFGFSGKLVTYNNTSSSVRITSIETDPEIIKRSEQLESATEHNVNALIKDRIQHAGQDKVDWEVLETLFSENAREQLMSYLGFERDQVVDAANALLLKIQPVQVKPTEVSTLFGHEKGASTRPDDTFFGQVSIPSVSRPFDFYPQGVTEDTDRLITRATVLGDFESAVNVCLATERFSDALMFAICGGSDLLARTQKTYFASQSRKYAYLRLLEGIVDDDLTGIVKDADLSDWSSVLVVLCTFAQSKDFGPLCEVMGDRLVKSELARNASLFYLAAGNLVKISAIWISQFEQEENHQDSLTSGVRLQELVEKVTIFRKAIEFEDTRAKTESGSYVLDKLYEKYCQYAELMATQGKLDVALKYIGLTPDEYVKGNMISRGLHDRVFHASKNVYGKPTFPFENKVKVSGGVQYVQPDVAPSWYREEMTVGTNHMNTAGFVSNARAPPSSNTTIGYYSAHQQPQQFQAPVMNGSPIPRQP